MQRRLSGGPPPPPPSAPPPIPSPSSSQPPPAIVLPTGERQITRSSSSVQRAQRQDIYDNNGASHYTQPPRVHPNQGDFDRACYSHINDTIIRFKVI